MGNASTFVAKSNAAPPSPDLYEDPLHPSRKGMLKLARNIKYPGAEFTMFQTDGYGPHLYPCTNLEFHGNYIPYFGFLSKQKIDKGCLPFALQSVLETLITKCHLTSWDVHGKGKTTLVLRWDSDNMAAIAGPDQSESVSFARYRKSHQVN